MVAVRATIVLIIDDFPLAREVLRRPLANLGIKNILEAADGEQGLAILKRQHDMGKPVGLVISDLNMPKMDGIKLLENRPRGRKPCVRFPSFLLTVEGQPARLRKALEAGAADYLVKPIIFATINQKLAQIVEKFGL